MSPTPLAILKQFEGKYFNSSASNAGRWLNFKLSKIEKGYAEVTVLVRKDMINPNQMLHGGMIAMIADELCGLAFYSMGNATYYTTVNLTVDYLYSAELGSTVTAIGKVVRCGKKIANTECLIYNEQQILIAHAKSNLVNTGKKVFELSLRES